ncbi:uncharacterized protein V6R79_016907 [Siganus canaliculatus]
MQNTGLLRILFALPLLILSKARDALGSGASCVSSGPADGGVTRVTFLRQDAAGVRSLFITQWSEDKRLLDCKVTSQPCVTERHRELCDENATEEEEISQKFNISALAAGDAFCTLVSSGASVRASGDGTEGKTRRKRAWIFPGTLWCGTGSKAVRYEQLGVFESADKCCREHDHCLHTIPALTVNYGLFNSRFYTLSHCNCDKRFRQCLLSVNDSISTMVGHSFFSILQVPCFEFKLHQCTGKYRCKVVKEAPYAFLKTPLPYNTSDIRPKSEDSTDGTKSSSSEKELVTRSPVSNPRAKSPKSESRCVSKGDTLHHRRNKPLKGCKTQWKLYPAAPSNVPPRPHSTALPMKTNARPATKRFTLMPSTSRAANEKSTRAGLFSYLAQQVPVLPLVTTKSYPQATSPTQDASSATQKPAVRLHQPTTAVRTTTSQQRASSQSHCCGVGRPLRGDALRPYGSAYLDQYTTSHVTTTGSLTTTDKLPRKVTMPVTQQHKKTTERQEQGTLATLAATLQQAAGSIHKVGKEEEQMYTHPLWNNTSQDPGGRTKAPSIHAMKSLKLNVALYNMTDKHLLCVSLKHLDKCVYKIPPLEKRYELQNTEAKTAFHCDCISRLAVQLESLKQPSTVPTLLMEFVSQYCFHLPKEGECQSGKSCSGGFTKASDLLGALKKIEETAGVRNSGSGRKRGIPVRFYKRCLRLEREADTMTRLT